MGCKRQREDAECGQSGAQQLTSAEEPAIHKSVQVHTMTRERDNETSLGIDKSMMTISLLGMFFLPGTFVAVST